MVYLTTKNKTGNTNSKIPHYTIVTLPCLYYTGSTDVLCSNGMQRRPAPSL